MRPPRLLSFILVSSFVFSFAPIATAQFWNPFRSKKTAEPVEQASFQAPAKGVEGPIEGTVRLQEKSGPWLIMATTFSGEGAEEQAQDLAQELKRDHGLPAYVHQITFDFTGGDATVGRGLDKYGAPIKMRYRSGEKRKEWAVLIGDFPTIDDPIATRTLAMVKTIRPASLDMGVDGQTSQNLAQIRRQQQAVLARLGKRPATQGPMRTAFMTRNPLLPEEYFVPKGVDKFVAKMNKGLDHSLLKAKGRYSVKVATFRGRGILQGATSARSSATRRKKRGNDPLVEAAENAHLLCEAMRRQGWEAYEFHDRTESYVTVGSFDTVAKNGQTPPLRQLKNLASVRTEVIEIIRTFGAAYDTPVTPLQKQRAPTNMARAEQVKQTFNELFTSEVGQTASGYNPKYAQVQVEKGKPMRPIPLDIHPHVIESPKKSVSSAFAWGR